MSEFVIEAVMDKRVDQGENLYYIKWMGYALEDSTWEPLDESKHRHIIREFEDRRAEELKNGTKKIVKVLGLLPNAATFSDVCVRFNDKSESFVDYKFVKENYPVQLISFFEESATFVPTELIPSAEYESLVKKAKQDSKLKKAVARMKVKKEKRQLEKKMKKARDSLAQKKRERFAQKKRDNLGQKKRRIVV